MTKTKEKILTTASVLRSLRKYLGPSFIRVKLKKQPLFNDQKWPAYSDGDITIEVLGVCEWKTSAAGRGNCVATRIRVEVSDDYRRYAGNRTYHTRRDGTFNYEGLLTSLNDTILLVEGAKETIARRKEEAQDLKRAEARMVKALAKELARFDIPANCPGRYTFRPYGDVRVRACVDEGKIDISVTGLSEARASHLLEALAEDHE